ncbi:MAG TPA: VOC family protein [Candidatus Acidoferrales bacterium]|nr:VOC family protein [Candidatus Acidoferrales bacterium]
MEQIISRMVEDYTCGKTSRRELIRGLAVLCAAATTSTTIGATSVGAAPAAASGTGFKAASVNHISYQCDDYAKTRDFYADLLGMEPHNDDGTQCYMRFGESVLIPRNMKDRVSHTAGIDHIAYTIENWNREAVEAELKRRGLNPRPDTQDSFHVRDINDYDLQICGPGMKL